MSDPCSVCDKEEVKSRRNSICIECDATVCSRCQFRHFVEKHG